MEPDNVTMMQTPWRASFIIMAESGEIRTIVFWRKKKMGQLKQLQIFKFRYLM